MLPFFFPTGFEFICSQAPYNMRGLLIGIFFSIHGLFSLVAILVEYLFVVTPLNESTARAVTEYSCAFLFYLILMCLAMLGMGVYVIAACRYKRRKRDDTFNQVGMLVGFFSSGQVHSSRWT